MCAAAISRSPVPPLVPGVPPKRAKKDEVEEKGEHREQESLAYDPALLCGTIYLELLDGIQPRQAADQIVRLSPEILFELSAQEPQNLVKAVKDHIAISEYSKEQHRNILSAVLILYSTSLMNSSFGENAKSLERSEVRARRNQGGKSELCLMLERSEKPHAAALIREANTILGAQIPPTIEGMKGKITAINKIIDAINHFQNLFYYHIPSNRARFENIFAYSNLFPNCQRLFPLLMQNLSILQQEKSELLDLRRALHEQTLALQEQVSALHAPRFQKLPEPREQLLEHQAVLLWEAGAELLEGGLKNVFLDKRKYKTYIPDPFRVAINEASRTHEFGQLTFNNLLANRIGRLPPKFVSDVWDRFRGERSRIVDISDLMRHIIGRLSDPAFKQLETDLKTSEDKKKTVLTALGQYFNGEFRGRSFTLIALKDWLRA